MNKPEYSDFHKFIASLGTILIATSILLPWLFLRESFETQLDVSSITQLPDVAQQLIEYRLHTALWVYQNLIVISLFLFFVGVMVLGSGLYPWLKKQKVLDRNIKLDTEKKEVELQDMTKEQLAEKAIRETIEDREDPRNIEATVSKQVDAVQKYFQAETIVFNKLSDCYGTHRVLRNKKIGSSEVDILVRLSSKERIVFEVKRTEHRTNVRRLIERSDVFLNRAMQAYDVEATGRRIYGIGIILVSKPLTNNAYKEYAIRRVMVFTESEFLNLDCGKLRDLINEHIQNN
ncbi:MAG: hypothetical protein HN916_00640 [Anaerolineae bacterium]|jgi:hypothetical protein|nr:hypothetical protein [Anaerolineae bacterium]MBT7990184.1 hypothetical protein [Anaerolineae bacterium]